MKRDLDYFIEKRAENLAMMHLTRNPDLSVERLQDPSGLELLVTIAPGHVSTGRLFGIQIKGQDNAISTPHDRSIPSSQSEMNQLKDYPFPVCELLFTMKDDRGYYRWLKAPTRQSLRSVAENPWNVLDNAQLEQMIEIVNSWYDEKSRSVA